MSRDTILRACGDHLRRSALIAALAAHLEIEWRRRTAPAGVLSLADEELIALDSTGRAGNIYADFSERAARSAITAANLSAICRCDHHYPDRLELLADAPAVLHIAGDPEALHGHAAIAIVGARRGTAYGLEVARALGRGIASHGVAVVSGLALGVDSSAHVGAVDDLAARRSAPECRLGRPVVVLAGGADVPYPSSRRALYRRVVERGCVVSEMPPGFQARRWSFVARNRIIAGLAGATIVVEAAMKSGSLTTADFAIQTGLPVGAVPGPVTSRFSAGTNELVAAGAAVIRGVTDALALLPLELRPDPCTDAARSPQVAALDPVLRDLFDAIAAGRGSLAELASDPTGATDVLRGVTELELRGLVKRGFGGRYIAALTELAVG